MTVWQTDKVEALKRMAAESHKGHPAPEGGYSKLLWEGCEAEDDGEIAYYCFVHGTSLKVL